MSLRSLVRPVALRQLGHARPTQRSVRFLSSASGSSSGSSSGSTFQRTAGWAAGAVLIAAAALSLSSANADTGADALSAASRGFGKRLRKVSLGELQNHAHIDSLWISIDGHVYDVTDFVAKHPGGIKILLDHAGQDVTKVFHAIHPPSTLAKHLNESQLVGELDDLAKQSVAAYKSPEEERVNAARAALPGVDMAVCIDDFERYAKQVLYTPAWAYFSTGSDTEGAMNENIAAFRRVQFRPRILTGQSSCDISTNILGVPSTLPIYVCPTARNGLGQSEGEVAVTRGAGAQGVYQVLSNYASRSLEEVKAAARAGQQIGWQLYLLPNRDDMAKMVREAVDAGAHSIWLTVDTVVLGKREAERRLNLEAAPIPNGTPLNRDQHAYSAHNQDISWADLEWVRALAPGLPVVVKGVGAWEDVEEAYKRGADAVVLSNHGGRQLDFAQPALKTLADVNANAPQVLHKPNFSIFLDGGVRRGSDVVKALCLGATAVGLGRPFIYAASCWGSDGVEKAIMILREEMEITMRLLGAASVEELGPRFLDTSKL